MKRLPPELVSNVLSRLPARCLMKCKCVCKSWFDLINDPHFISNHYVAYNNLIHSPAQEEHLLVIGKFSTLKAYIYVLSWNINDPTKHVSSSFLNYLGEEYHIESLKYRSEVKGPCNGIYFQQGYPDVIMNPSLRQFIALPAQSNFTALSDAYYFTEYAGFGFDPKTNDYKVIVIKYRGLKDAVDGKRIGVWKAELYSLNSNSWRKLDAAFPLQTEFWVRPQVYTYVSNCCHWFGYQLEGVLVAFDMVNESFRKIKLPPYIRFGSGEYVHSTLVPFNESATICVIVHCLLREKDQACYDVWVMKDYWDEGSWTKQYSVEVPLVMIRSKLVGFYGSNKFIWRDSDERLVLYDPDSKVKTKDLLVFGRYDKIRVARYMESLVSLQRGKEISQQFLFRMNDLNLFI